MTPAEQAEQEIGAAFALVTRRLADADTADLFADLGAGTAAPEGVAVVLAELSAELFTKLARAGLTLADLGVDEEGVEWPDTAVVQNAWAYYVTEEWRMVESFKREGGSK